MMLDVWCEQALCRQQEHPRFTFHLLHINDRLGVSKSFTLFGGDQQRWNAIMISRLPDHKLSQNLYLL